VRARAPERLPVVLSQTEVAAILARLNGVEWLVVILLHGGGLRLEECLALRVKDIDLERRQVVVQPDRTTRQGSEINWGEASALGDAHQHARSDFFVVVKGEDEIGPAGTFECSMRA